MASRIDLNNELKAILGSANVYFQPPEGFKMRYPCIRYSLDGEDVKPADDVAYKTMRRYTLIVIDKDPDNMLYEKLVKHFQYCRLKRTYVADNLNHYILDLYY